MAFELKDGQGSLWKNEKKVGGDKLPDYKGAIKVEGTEYWIAAWLKKTAKGVTYMSLSVQKKDEQPKNDATENTSEPSGRYPTQERPPAPPTAPAPQPQDSEEAPF